MIKKFKLFDNKHDDIDPYGEEDWDDELIKFEPRYRFRNYYRCTCGEEWGDEWDAMCDDECPECGTIMTPYRSEDI